MKLFLFSYCYGHKLFIFAENIEEAKQKAKTIHANFDKVIFDIFTDNELENLFRARS